MCRAAGFVVVVIAGLMLSACSAPAESNAPSMPVATRSATMPSEPDAPVESASSVEAVLSVASVDVDGLRITAAGYIGGLIEDGGACVFNFESGDITATAQSTGRADRATTSCGTVSVPREELARGSSSVVLTYMTLDGREIASDAIGLEIP